MFWQLWNKFWTTLFFFESDPGFPQELLEVLFEDDGSHYEMMRIDGTVTMLHESQSLAIINHDIYMDLSISIPGGRKLRLNDFVVAIVKRRCEDDAWRVERVELIERVKKSQSSGEDQWITPDSGELQSLTIETNDENLKAKTLVGQVTEISNNKVIVNNGETELPLSYFYGLTYVVGDWLKLKILYDPEEWNQKPTCISAEPLRQWKFEGRITILQEDYGIVDNDIYFQLAACQNG